MAMPTPPPARVELALLERGHTIRGLDVPVGDVPTVRGAAHA